MGSLINLIAIWWYSTVFVLFASIVTSLLALYVYKVSKIRSVVIALLFGFLVGAAVYIVHLTGDYHQFINDVSVHLNFSQKGNAKQIADAIIRQATGSSGLLGYLQFEAKNGIILNSSGGYGGGTPYTGAGAWFFLIFDMLIYLLFPTAVVGGVAAKDVL